MGKDPACDTEKAGLTPGSGSPLEEGMATPTSILAQRIPRTEEPGGLQSTGSQSQTPLKRLSTFIYLALPGLRYGMWGLVS